MNLPLYIAGRYLFSKKSHHAINIVSLISVCGVAVGTMALVCVLSVFNGFQGIVEGLFGNFDPQLKITAKQDKVFDPVFVSKISEMPDVEYCIEVLQENALLVFRDKQTPVVVKGVPDDYAKINHISDIILDGDFKTKEGSFDMAVGGIGLVRTIGCGVHYVEPLQLYAPKRSGNVNMIRPDEAFKREIAFLTGIFMVQQEKYDNNLLIVSMSLARRLFDYEKEVSAVEIKLKDGANEKKVQASISKMLGDDFSVQNRYEQQEDFFRMMEIEKWITYLILSFILLIAVFNIIGSLSMLMIDKKEDIKILENMGASQKLIFRIFLLEGWLISFVGMIFGIILGLILCWLQIQFGLVSLGTAGSFIVDAYPVSVQFLDIVLVFVTVGILGLLASFYPAKQVYKRNN
ncbi:MAG: FtsX-like permease family protein [Paludibacteraceae bacterium]|nr:FtsX-like permease family protein [Paludibacteraceae bacterium]